jgi:hypothetical protein
MQGCHAMGRVAGVITNVVVGVSVIGRYMRRHAANASALGQRGAIHASPLHELTGFYLTVDCLAPRCNWRAQLCDSMRVRTEFPRRSFKGRYTTGTQLDQ